jgi:DNA-3-methyladenine glycosylase II
MRHARAPVNSGPALNLLLSELPEVNDMSEHIVNHLCASDRNMSGLIRAVGPYALVLENETQPFEALAQAIAHQQLHGAAARNILARFVANVGNGAFPMPQAVLAAPEKALRAAGFSLAKIAALKDLATKTIEGVVPEREALARLEDSEIIARLTEVRGIGRWTVEMLLMFHLGRPDILPVDDFGIRAGFQYVYGLRKMPAPKAVALYGERWAPYRSAAAWYLWRAVELKKAGKLPEPVEQIRLPRVLKLRRRARRAVAPGAEGARKAAAAGSMPVTLKAGSRAVIRTGVAKKVVAAANAANLKALRSSTRRPSPKRPKKAKSKRAYR